MHRHDRGRRQRQPARDRGLSDFEKALLIGLGGAVVGSLLNNGDEVVSSSGDRVVVRRDGEVLWKKTQSGVFPKPGEGAALFA